MTTSAHLFLLLALCSIAASRRVRDPRPTQTSVVEDGYPLVGFTPKPTSMPSFGELKKRAYTPNSTCGYVTGDAFDALTCNTGYCAQDSTDKILGCCTSYYSTGGSYSGSGCKFHTACVPFDGVKSCSSACINNIQNLICSDASYPYCMEYYATDAGYKVLGCTDTSNLIINIAMTYDEGTATSSGTPQTTTVQGFAQPSDTRTASATGAFPTNVGEDNSSSGTSSGSSSSNSSSRKKKGVGVGAIAGGIVGGLVVIGAIVAFFIRRNRRRTPEHSAPAEMIHNPNSRPDSAANKAPETFVTPASGNSPPAMAAQAVPIIHGANTHNSLGVHPPTSPTLSTTSHRLSNAQSPTSHYPSEGFAMTSPSLSAQSMASPTALAPPSPNTHEADSRTPTQPNTHTSPSLSAHSVVGGRESMPSTNLVPQEVEASQIYYPPPPPPGSPPPVHQQQGPPGIPPVPSTIHEAPGHPMASKATPSSNWSGPHEMAG